MVPHSCPVQDTSRSRLVRPRRSSTSLWTQNPASQQERGRDSQAVVKKNGEQEVTSSPVIGGQQGCLMGITARSENGEPVEHRFDTAHGPETKRHGTVPPKRRLSFGGLLGGIDSRSGVGSATTHEGCRDQHCEALPLLELEASPDAGHVSANTFDALNSISDHEGKQNVDPRTSALGADVEVPSGEARDRTGQHSIGFDAEDCLKLHATDLIRRIQAWSEALARKETQLNARISRQEQRERRYRARSGN